MSAFSRSCAMYPANDQQIERTNSERELAFCPEDKRKGRRLGECDRGANRIGYTDYEGHTWGRGDRRWGIHGGGGVCVPGRRGALFAAMPSDRFRLPTASSFPSRPIRSARPDATIRPGKKQHDRNFQKKILKKCYTVSFECIQKETLKKMKKAFIFSEITPFCIFCNFFTKCLNLLQKCYLFIKFCCIYVENFK